MPEFSQRTLSKVIPILEAMPPDKGYGALAQFWRTKLFGAGIPDWLTEFVIDNNYEWSLVIPRLYKGQILTRSGILIGREMCVEMLRHLYIVALRECPLGPARDDLKYALKTDGFVKSEDVASVAAPVKLRITSRTVDLALTDAETLLRSSGPPNALDRAHTAFHGYLKQICDDGGITVSEDASITELFSQIRQKHPKLQITDSQAQQMMVKIGRGAAQIVGALNPVRNDKSLAHPNILLDEPEAMLAINAIRTMLHYLDKKLQ